MNQQEYIKQLRDALQALVDVQDGTPFHKYEREWKAAMAEAERLLAIEPPAEKSKRYGCKSDPWPSPGRVRNIYQSMGMHRGD